jgi:hypothetical protein
MTTRTSTDLTPLPAGQAGSPGEPGPAHGGPGGVAGLAAMPAVTALRGGGPDRIRHGRLALGMAVPVAGEPLIIVAAAAVSALRPGSGPPVFLAAQLLGIAGCAAVWQRARARGDRGLVRGLAIGLVIVAGAALLCAAAVVAAAAIVMNQPD